MANTADLHQVERITREGFHFCDEDAFKYVTEVMENSVWRKAVTVDGGLYWATPDPGDIGEPVHGKFQMRSFGDFVLLAPDDDVLKEDPDVTLEKIRR
jgi:hypothetical protein